MRGLDHVLCPSKSDLFTIRENIKNLRGTNKLVIPKVNTTRYGTVRGLHCFKSLEFTSGYATLYEDT